MRWRRWARSFVALVGLSMTLACGGQERVADGEEELLPQPYLTLAPGPDGPFGLVQETMRAQGYTYARLATDDGDVWLAGPLAELAIGDTVSLAGADNMGAFRSPALDRSFERIFFVTAFRSPSSFLDTYVGTVVESMDAQGYTYVQVEVDEALDWMVAAGAEGLLVWLAGPRTDLPAGSEVRWTGGTVMREFHSATLQRTFAEIVFVEAFTLADGSL